MGAEQVGLFLGSLILGGAGGFAGAKAKQKLASEKDQRDSFLTAASQQAALGNRAFFDSPEIMKAFKSAGAEESIEVFKAIAGAELTQEQRGLLFKQMQQKGAAAETGTGREKLKSSLIEEITGRGEELGSPAAGFEAASPEVLAAVIPPAGQVAAQAEGTKAGERIAKRQISHAERVLDLQKNRLVQVQKALTADTEKFSGLAALEVGKENPGLTLEEQKTVADFFIKGTPIEDAGLRTRIRAPSPDSAGRIKLMGEAIKKRRLAFDVLKSGAGKGVLVTGLEAKLGLFRQHNELMAESLRDEAQVRGWTQDELAKKLKENLFTWTTHGIDKAITFADADRKGIPEHKLKLKLLDFVGGAEQLSPAGQNVLDEFLAGGATP